MSTSVKMSTSVNMFNYINIPSKVTNYNGSPLSGEWLLFDIEGKRNFNSRQYQIYVLLDKNTKKIYMKPSIPYFSANFETLFGFGIGCSEYNSEKIIVVKEPVNYYEKFEKYF